jgi:hypothetical protein
MEQLSWIRLLAYSERSTYVVERAAELQLMGRLRDYRRLWTDLRHEVLRVAERRRTAARPQTFRNLSEDVASSLILCTRTGASMRALSLAVDGTLLRCAYWHDGVPDSPADVQVQFDDEVTTRLVADDGRQRRTFDSTTELASHLISPLVERPRARRRRGWPAAGRG